MSNACMSGNGLKIQLNLKQIISLDRPEKVVLEFSVRLKNRCGFQTAFQHVIDGNSIHRVGL